MISKIIKVLEIIKNFQ